VASLVTPANGDLVTAELLAQLTELFGGLRNIPVSLTGINDAAAYALTLKNAGTGARDAIMYAADGSTVLFQVSGSGVLASRAGGAAEAIITTGSAFFGTWTAFTPTLSQTASLTLSVATGRYLQIGKLVIASIDVTINSAGTAGGTMVLGGLPVGSTQHGIAAVGRYFDQSAGTYYLLSGLWSTATTMQFISHLGAGGFGNNPAVTAAASDTVFLNLAYEAA
jgi:hypothetical protein